jgi:hypothetical protein
MRTASRQGMDLHLLPFADDGAFFADDGAFLMMTGQLWAHRRAD